MFYSHVPWYRHSQTHDGSRFFLFTMVQSNTHSVETMLRIVTGSWVGDTRGSQPSLVMLGRAASPGPISLEDPGSTA